MTSSSISSSANNLNGGRRAIDASDDTSMASSFMSEAAARLTLRAPPRVLSISPNHGAAEGGTAVIARWVKRTAVAASSLSEAGGKGDASGEGVGMELDGGAAACRFGTLGPIRGWVIAGGAGVECVAPAGKATRSFGGNDATVTVSVRAGTSGWSDTPSSPTSPSSSFTYASVWKPQQAVPRFVAALPAGGGGEADALREGSGSALGGGATVLLLGRGFPPLSDPAAACAGMPRAAVLAVGYGRALCKVAVDVAAAADAGGMEAMPGPAPFAVSFVITAAPWCCWLFQTQLPPPPPPPPPPQPRCGCRDTTCTRRMPPPRRQSLRWREMGRRYIVASHALPVAPVAAVVGLAVLQRGLSHPR